MRLWSLHPSLLDRAGLLALWREGLLAQSVLAGRTKGYKHHPQLERFRNEGLSYYLEGVWCEAYRRGYNFDLGKVDLPQHLGGALIPVTTGQLAYEVKHLTRKLQVRAPERLPLTVQEHPIFEVIEGPIASWERVDTQAKVAYVVRT